MNVIVLHDRYSNEPVVIRVDAINAVRKFKDGEEEYSELLIDNMCVVVKETIGIVMNRIQKQKVRERNESRHKCNHNLRPYGLSL